MAAIFIMPTLVHIADERETASILNAGIRPRVKGAGVYCMPVLPNFYVSHQWLRELKRSGPKTYVGVYFKLSSDEMVFAGRYNEKHRHLRLGDAIGEIMSLDDPLGYELIIDRKIEPKEISSIRHLSQTLGWRYSPKSNGKRPCACEYCLRGTIKGRRTKNRLDPE